MPEKKKHILEVPINHPMGTLAAVIVMVVLGLIAFLKLPTNLMPDIVYPMVRVQVNAGQTPPDILINTVTRVLEQQLTQAEGVELVESTTVQGEVQINLSFNYSKDIDAALQNVASLVDRAKGQLPNDIEAPIIFKFDPQNLPVLELVMTSPTMNIIELRSFADKDLVYRFVGIPGVSVVRPAGGRIREVQVQVSPEKLKQYNLTLAELNTLLATENTQRSVGRLDVAGREHFALATSLADSVQEIRDLKLKLSGGNLIQLSDVADVQDTYQEQRIITTANGTEGVKLSFFKNPQANSVDVAQAITTRLQELKTSGALPSGLNVAVTSDESTYIVNSISGAKHALLLAIALVALIVLIFLKNWRFTMISMAVLPVALLSTIFLMNAFGLSLNLMSIGGLIVGVTLMIDYGIVFIENINRHWIETKDVRVSVRLAAREVSSPLTTALIALVAIITPFLFFGGLTLLFFKEFILVVIFATVSGLLIAFILIPALYSLKGISGNANTDHEGLRIDRLIRYHKKAMNVALKYRNWTVALGALALVLTVFISGKLGNIFLPEIDDGRVTIQIQTEPGTLLADMQAQVQRIERVVMAQPDVVLVDATTGGQIGQTVHETPGEAEMLVQLVPKTERQQSVQDFMAALSDTMVSLDLVGMKVKVKKARIRAIRTFSGTASSGDFDVVVNVQGQDPKILSELGDKVRNTLRSVNGLTDVRSTLVINQPTLRFTIDKVKAATFGLSSQYINQTLSDAISGSTPSQFLQEGEFYNIRLMVDRKAIYRNLTGLPELPIGKHNNGDALLLGQVADIQYTKGPLAIDRVNQSTVNMINGGARGRTLGVVAADVQAAMDTLQLPPGYSISYGGRMATLSQGGSGLIWVGLFGLFLLFVVLVISYESLANPLLITAVLPIGLLGSVIALLISGIPLSSTAMIGFILVIGIATNNAIVLVAFIEQLRKEGKSLYEAVNVGTSLRIQPKLMTALIAMAGMVPLAIAREEGGEILQPLALAILGGMPVALMATLIVLPVIYLMVHERKIKKEEQKG